MYVWKATTRCQCQCGPKTTKFKRKGGIKYEDESLDQSDLVNDWSQYECTCGGGAAERSIENSQSNFDSDDSEAEHQKAQK